MTWPARCICMMRDAVLFRPEAILSSASAARTPNGMQISHVFNISLPEPLPTGRVFCGYERTARWAVASSMRAVCVEERQVRLRRVSQRPLGADGSCRMALSVYKPDTHL